MKIKICGLTYPSNIEEVHELLPDFIGFIFYRSSPRYAGDTLSAHQTWNIPNQVKKVGVFVNESNYNILEYTARFNLDLVQLHGTESAQQCAELQKYVPVIKSFLVGEYFDHVQLKSFEEHCSYFLFDSLSSSHGGSGKQFDHRLLNPSLIRRPYFISGGLDPDSIEKLNNQCYGLDFNSKLETAPGYKDIEKVKQTINKIKKR